MIIIIVTQEVHNLHFSTTMNLLNRRINYKTYSQRLLNDKLVNRYKIIVILICLIKPVINFSDWSEWFTL